MQNLMVKNLRLSSFSIALLLYLGLANIAQAQKDSLLLKGNFSHIATDQLNSLYTVTKQDTLKRYNASTALFEYEYSNSRLGKISAVDVSNPLQLIVAYNDFSTLVLLDVTLREIAQVRLPELQIFNQHIAFAQNNDDTAWLYDELNAQLVRFTINGEIVSRNQSLINEVNFVPEVSQMQSNANTILLVCPQKGFIVCDQFGEFNKFIPYSEFESVQLVKDHLIIKSNNELILYPIDGIGKQELATDLTAIEQLIVLGEQLLLLKEDGIYLRALEE